MLPNNQAKNKIRSSSSRQKSNKSLSSDVIVHIKDQQKYQSQLIKLSEYSTSKPLTQEQKDVLLLQGDRLKFLGLELVSDILTGVSLKASQIVGSTRFVHERKEVIVQVEPKVKNVDFFRMLSQTNQPGKVNKQITELGIQNQSPVQLLLEFFADQTLAFLNRKTYRNYSFTQTIGNEPVKGRPLINDYLRKSLPKAQPFVLPCRFLDYTSDTIENQIVAFAVRLATNATALLTSNKVQLLKKLTTCSRLLTGVSINRISTREIRNLKYNRLNMDFQPIHKLCEMIIGNFSLSLQAGERIPFLSLAVDMARLFEDYAALCFQNAFPQDFIGNKAKLRFSLNSFGKEIILDGLLNFSTNKAVIECKYKVIENNDANTAGEDTFNVQGGKIRGVDIYQTTAYASHEKIRAGVGILVYPFSPNENSPAVQISPPIKSLGWFNSGHTGISIYLVGLNLSATFKTLVSELKDQVKIILTGNNEL